MVTPQETRHKSKNVFNWKKKQVVALRLSMDINQEERERDR
jgi:hypothetical protein